ncbi:MAG: protein kinase, partial [Planctomycetota bacterium]
MKVHCPECQGTFRVEGHETGTAFRCPFCEAQFAFQDRETPVAVGNPNATVTTEDEPNLVDSRFGPNSEKAENLGEGAPSGETPSPLKSVEKDSPNSAADTPSPSSSDPTRLLDDSARFPSAPSTPPEELTDIRPGDLIHGYQIEEIIGSGGMSVVFRATQASLGRNVAFKVLRKDLGEDEEFAERFRTEARALAELNHPNIVAVYEQGEHEGSYYLVMEFVDGVSLRDVMEERRLTPEEAFQIIPSLCSALEYAHTKNIIHRDIKPENILVDRAGTPRIADFGLVRIVGDAAPATRLTKTQTVLGTLDYMAPEQREGCRDIDHRADIYSLGVVLYEMLTGELPIARFPRPSERARLEHGVDDIVLKVLEKDRERRYQRASMVARDLTRVQTGVRRTHPDHDSAPDTIAGRLVAMGTSFSFFFFTVVYIAVMAINSNDRTICLVTGMAVPFYLGSLVLNGILPRPVVRPKNFLVKHPVIAGGLLTFFSVLLLEERVIDREPGLFFAGLFVSYAVLVWCWRKKIFRSSASEPAFVPWAGPPRGYEDLRAGKLPESARNFV